MSPPENETVRADSTDPRLSLAPDGERDIRPVVGRSGAGLSNAAIAILTIGGGVVLFAALDARRLKVTAPAVIEARETSVSRAPPPLFIPPLADAPTPSNAPVAAPAPPLSAASTAHLQTPVQTRVEAAHDLAQPMPASPSPPVADAAPVSPRTVGGPALIVDTSTEAGAGRSVAEEADRSGQDGKRPTLSTSRARAAMLANRATTVPQGTLIPAVLETGFDSTSPGFARALIQKDVRGFDGTRILIPRGSRLIGEYGADVEHGQRRAVILWSRLIRPDGVTIAIGSPAADTVGRGGVKADVDAHFLERFSGAILQSALDVGIALAARGGRSPVIVALPSAGGRVASTVPTQGRDITPTLRVPPGRSVGVFVARDLDFSEADGAR